ncbi:hypothetical protein TD95_002228 [Thielaviopsis punctulata]|uniref:non-specific serine/threonine protein kinase n=1 Tax=Thielaviopsis punctulata TaxID=72032 RepID=A0A0F4ZJ72_9PEZI|nr:hypothetical protein TD95_002228 [Thielaviopsis punctulata]
MSSRMIDSEHRVAPFRHGSYEMLSEVGKGSFARVMKARNIETNVIYAIKMVNKKRLNAKLMANLQTEIQIMKNTRHPGTIMLEEFYDTEGHVNLVMEFCKLGDLSKFIKNAGKLRNYIGFGEMDHRYPSQSKAVNPVIVRLFTRQLVDAVRFLHARNLIHRDIKPQNILLDLEDISKLTSERKTILKKLASAIGVSISAWKWLPLVKLADFGFARHLPSTSLAETLCGSPLYMGPEILRYEHYDAKTDLWSLGAVIFEMMTGKPPFRAKNHIELLKRIDTTNVEFAKDRAFPKDMQSFILGLLKKNPLERMSFEATFSHPAMTSKITELYDDDQPSMPSKISIPPTQLREQPEPTKPADMASPIARTGSSRGIKSAFSPVVHNGSPRRNAHHEAVVIPESPRRSANRMTHVGPDGFTHTPVTSARSPTASSAFPPPPPPPQTRRVVSRDSSRSGATGLGIQGQSQTMANAPSPQLHGPGLLEMKRALEEATSPDMAFTDRIAGRPSSIGRRSKLAHHVTADMANETDYVVVEKKQVEVNAIADEMAASPKVNNHNQLVRKSNSSTAVNIPRKPSSGNNRNSFEASPSGRSPSSISRAIQDAGMRFFGYKVGPNRIVHGQSPPIYSPYPSYTPPPGTGLITDGRNAVESQYSESRVAQIIEDYANRSDCIWGFANVKFQQLIPDGSMSEIDEKQAGSDAGELTDDAVVVLSEEALLLYVKALEILSTAIDFAAQWWARQSRDEESSSRTAERISLTMQWLRDRFNDTLEKVEIVRLRLTQAQKRLPEDHPAHPSHHVSEGTMNIGSGTLNVYISSKTTADKLIYDRALEMCKHAAGDEMYKRNLSVCDRYYSTALRMMEALYDRDGPKTSSSDNEYDENDQEDDQLHLAKSEYLCAKCGGEKRADANHLYVVMTLIRGRLNITQAKIRSIKENEKIQRSLTGGHQRSGSVTPVSVISN